MRWLIPPLFITCLGIFLSALAQRPSPTPVANPPKPVLSLSLERSAIRENDQLQAKIWISNDWDKPISDVILRVNTPTLPNKDDRLNQSPQKFLTWSNTSCAEWKNAIDDAANIGTIGPRDFREITICLKSGPDVLIGDFNVSFICEYAWAFENQKGRSFVTAEKTLKSNLLGSDSVAGVPITLAAFIVPGLFFWIVVGFLKVPWNIGSGLGDKLVYSVIVSIILLWILNWWQADLGGAIGLYKLFKFALAGAVVGLVAGFTDHGRQLLVRRYRENKAKIAKAGEVKLGDESDELLRKLVKLHPNCRKPQAVIRLKDGTEYIGSLMAETSEIVALIGWFRILKQNIQGPNRAQIIAELEQAKQPIDLYNLAIQYNLQIEPRNGIKQITNGAESEIDEKLTIPHDGVTAEQHCDTPEDDVLVLE